MQQLAVPDISKSLKKCNVLVQKALTAEASKVDATDWATLAPPATTETTMYASANPTLIALASAQTLQNCSATTQQRGVLYPFVMGNFKTNSLQTATEWLCNQHAAALVLTDKLRCTDAQNFCHLRGETWHVLEIMNKLGNFPGMVPAAYAAAKLVASLSLHVDDTPLQAACMDLAKYCFILECPSMPHPPSEQMLKEVYECMAGKPGSNARVSSLFPKHVVDEVHADFAQQKKCAHTGAINNNLAGLLQFYSVPKQLAFTV